MKCLTFKEAEDWFLSKGIAIDVHRNLVFPVVLEKIMTTMPKEVAKLSRLASALGVWVSHDAPKCLWISNWGTEPMEQIIQFETMRHGCAESRHLIEAPGHVFELITDREEAVLAGLLFLISSFNWEGYLVSEKLGEFVYLGDEHIVFSSRDPEKMHLAADIVRRFDLKIIQDIRQAWISNTSRK